MGTKESRDDSLVYRREYMIMITRLSPSLYVLVVCAIIIMTIFFFIYRYLIIEMIDWYVSRCVGFYIEKYKNRDLYQQNNIGILTSFYCSLIFGYQLVARLP